MSKVLGELVVKTKPNHVSPQVPGTPKATKLEPGDHFYRAGDVIEVIW